MYHSSRDPRTQQWLVSTPSPQNPERRLARNWPPSPSTVVLGAQNVYFLTFGAGGGGGHRDQADGKEAQDRAETLPGHPVSHTFAQKPGSRPCQNRRGSQQSAELSLSPSTTPPHQEDAPLSQVCGYQKNRICGSLLDCLRTICHDLGSEKADQGLFHLEVKQPVRAPR